MPPEQKPSIGRIVHFVGERDSINLAALVTAVNEDDTINLAVFGPNGGYGFRQNVKHVEGPVQTTEEASGTWHFPERI